MTQEITYHSSIPAKSLWSYILYLWPMMFIFSPLRKIVAKFGLPNCKEILFEPGFRFYYGKNIFAKKVIFSNTLLVDYAPITIGEGTAFSKDNKVITGSHDIYDRQKVVAKPITIGKNVWVTTNCVILPGVTIGDNSVIGAGSIVTKDIPANVIAAGNPCKVIKKINQAELISGFYP
jgi:maltose O-acetyltransferase